MFFCFAPAVTRLLRLCCPAARARAGAFRPERRCSLGRGEESSSAPLERNAKHEHNIRPHHHRMPRNRSAADQQSHQANQIPCSTAEMENRFIEGNVPRPKTFNSARHQTRQPPISNRISRVILTSILNVNVWWFSFLTHVGASKVIIWCPLERWIRSFVIPGKFFDWRLWQVRQQSSLHTIIRMAIRLRPRRTSKLLVISSERVSF